MRIRYALIPKPQELVRDEGEFRIESSATTICYRDDCLAFAATWLSDQLSRTFGTKMMPSKVASAPAGIASILNSQPGELLHDRKPTTSMSRSSEQSFQQVIRRELFTVR